MHPASLFHRDRGNADCVPRIVLQAGAAMVLIVRHCQWRHAKAEGLSSSNDLFEQVEFSFKRRVFDIGVKPGGCFHYALPVSEHIKRKLSVISTNAAVASSSKG